jgi:NADPH:quinone reductase-like Zn-dependent oxidoreductase
MIVQKGNLFPGNFDSKKVGPILVHGAGSGVSHALLELLISFGIPPSDLWVSSRTEKKLEAWRKRGLQTVLFSEDKMAGELRQRTGGKRFSVIFDHVGKASFAANLKLLENGGKLITCGATSGFEVGLDLRHIFFRQLQILGSTMGSLQHFQDMIRWVAYHRLSWKLSKVFPVTEVKSAYASLAAGEQDGKIVLQF